MTVCCRKDKFPREPIAFHAHVRSNKYVWAAKGIFHSNTASFPHQKPRYSEEQQRLKAVGLIVEPISGIKQPYGYWLSIQ